jgi:hypothetical protein
VHVNKIVNNILVTNMQKQVISILKNYQRAISLREIIGLFMGRWYGFGGSTESAGWLFY